MCSVGTYQIKLQVPYLDRMFELCNFLPVLISNANHIRSGTKYVGLNPTESDNISAHISHKNAKIGKPNFPHKTFNPRQPPPISPWNFAVAAAKSTKTCTTVAVDELIFANDYQHQHTRKASNDDDGLDNDGGSNRLKYTQTCHCCFRLVHRFGASSVQQLLQWNLSVLSSSCWHIWSFCHCTTNFKASRALRLKCLRAFRSGQMKTVSVSDNPHKWPKVTSNKLQDVVEQN